MPDATVIGTGRLAEGTAIGFNRKKKGQRSYYPLFCTVAQTSQVFDVLHRSGNVTLRRRVIQRAGRLIYPQSKLTLSLSANNAVKNELLQSIEALKSVA